MGRVDAYHDGRLGGHYHQTSECRAGQLIPRERRLLRTGGNPLCEECRILSAAQDAGPQPPGSNGGVARGAEGEPDERQ